MRLKLKFLYKVAEFQIPIFPLSWFLSKYIEHHDNLDLIGFRHLIFLKAKECLDIAYYFAENFQTIYNESNQYLNAFNGIMYNTNYALTTH